MKLSVEESDSRGRVLNGSILPPPGLTGTSSEVVTLGFGGDEVVVSTCEHP
jgi:hypothetical protein